MKRQHKNDGISLIVALGGSLLVLSIGLATLISISRSLEQSASLERSTKLFFAAESGIEGAFFHHNARGAGLDMVDGSIEFPGGSGDFPQRIPHFSGSVESEWTIESRETPIVGLLKEGQSVQIPLFWDDATNPKAPPPVGTPTGLGAAPGHHFALNFYKSSGDMGAIQSVFEDQYGVVDITGLVSNFDFGKSSAPDGEQILIDWSLTRKNNNEGVQTFSPREEDCSLDEDFICEDSFRSSNSAVIDIGGGAVATNISALPSKDTKVGGRNGRVLPGLQQVTLQDFMECDDVASTGDTCSEYTLTFRPLLKFEDTVNSMKIPGIPYTLTGNDGGSISIPEGFYTVNATVREDDFSQTISLEVPERTSIGAFDYVIFD